MRAFCTSAEVPPLRAVIEWVGQQGVALRVAGDAGVHLDSTTWEEAAISYKDGRQPILCTVSRDTGVPRCLCGEEIREFQAFLLGVAETGARGRVLEHLQRKRYVVANQLLASDIDEDGYAASSSILDYFVEHAGGLVQADGEGFYEDGEVSVALP